MNTVNIIKRKIKGKPEIVCNCCGSIVQEATLDIELEMPYCGECGKRIEDAAHMYCGYCGINFEEEQLS